MALPDPTDYVEDTPGFVDLVIRIEHPEPAPYTGVLTRDLVIQAREGEHFAEDWLAAFAQARVVGAFARSNYQGERLFVAAPTTPAED